MNLTFDLNTIWFFLVGFLLTGYAILDGFDLGVGALHLFTRTDLERRTMLNAIGPVWDGNEVWLITGGGALFAAFPEVYATAFSGFYLALMLLLFALIFRAVAIEFRGKRESRRWRQCWDVAFLVGSVLAGFLFGVALGNVARGIPLSDQFEYAGTFWGLLNPYALLAGITTVSLFSMHGAIYVAVKTEGDLQDRARHWAKTAAFAVVVSCVALTAMTWLFVPHLVEVFRKSPVLLIFPLLTVPAVVNVVRELRRGRDFRAFVSSGAIIAALILAFGLGQYPHVIFSHPAAENSLTIYNASSSVKTLSIMLVIAVIGMPLVIGYTGVIYRIFRGKVKVDASGY